MSDWFTSSKGAIALSVFGLLTFVAYSFLVSRYLLEQLTPGVGAAFVETLIVLAIVGSWIWGLLLASTGNNKGWIILLVASLLPTLFTLYDLAFYSPIPYGWPLLQIVVWAAFITNIAASTATIVQFSIRQDKGLEEALSDLDENSQKQLEELRRLLALQRALAKRETERLTRKLGKDRPRAEMISVNFYHNKHLAQNAELHKQADCIIVEEAPLIPLYYVQSQGLQKPWVKGLTFTPLYDAYYKDVIITKH